MPLTGVDTSPESGLWSTERGVRVTPRSEYWDEWDLGKLPLRVFTPEELRERERKRRKRRKRRDREEDTLSHVWSLILKGSCPLRNVSPGVR